MCDRSWSRSTGAGIDALPPHIRDALEATAATEDATAAEALSGGLSSSNMARSKAEDVEAVEAELSESRARCDELAAALAEREREVRELRGYARDAAKMTERDHAYLRATHLDPAVALEIDLLKRRLETAGAKLQPDPKQQHEDLAAERADLVRKNAGLVAENDELAAAAAAAEAERDFLRLTVRQLREQLASAREWNDQLEEEREDLYGMIDDLKSRTSNGHPDGGGGAAVGCPDARPPTDLADGRQMPLPPSGLSGPQSQPPPFHHPPQDLPPFQQQQHQPDHMAYPPGSHYGHMPPPGGGHQPPLGAQQHPGDAGGGGGYYGGGGAASQPYYHH